MFTFEVKDNFKLKALLLKIIKKCTTFVEILNYDNRKFQHKQLWLFKKKKHFSKIFYMRHHKSHSFTFRQRLSKIKKITTSTNLNYINLCKLL